MAAAPLRAFSPYENYLHSGRTTHVGLLAQAAEGREAELLDALRALGERENTESLSRAGIESVSAFHREIGGAMWAVVYFAYEGGRDYLSAAKAFEQAAPAVEHLAEWTVPHPRAERHGTHWLQMEWINYIRGRDVPAPPKDRLMIVTTLKPEKEQKYRTLHQTVWPGVVDQLMRSNNRNLSIFLATLGDELVEFLYLEYVGDDREADEAMSQSDEINQRWWQLTDACQKPLPGVDGIWDLMTPVGGGVEDSDLRD
ncbi:MAG: L-rhamnose mutarotase [Opitutales bacterium]|nr:L-rhamnose mutarotase [Opitutales bacterium]